MRRIKFIVAYDGTNYHGFAKQNNALTIQEVLEKAIFAITHEEVEVIGAGRTDTGVHAKGQCCVVDSMTQIPVYNLLKAVNSKLPKDIVIKEMIDVTKDFHPRYKAKQKTYRYQIFNGQTLDPFTYKYAYFYPYPLDVEKMIESAKYIIGTHDFKCFCSAGGGAKTTTRTVYSLDIQKIDELIQINICGNGFLYNMVRIIVGTLIEVGRGQIAPCTMEQIIASLERKKAGPTAPPEGLMMLNIEYDVK